MHVGLPHVLVWTTSDNKITSWIPPLPLMITQTTSLSSHKASS